MKRILIIPALVLLSSSVLRAEYTPPPPDILLKGASIFNAHCAKCHGDGGSGTDKGPPLVNKIYHPNHHADITFYWAVERGVRAHHWNFGDMTKIDGVSKDDTGLVIRYIRDLQKRAGIY